MKTTVQVGKGTYLFQFCPETMGFQGSITVLNEAGNAALRILGARQGIQENWAMVGPKKKVLYVLRRPIKYSTPMIEILKGKEVVGRTLMGKRPGLKGKMLFQTSLGTFIFRKGSRLGDYYLVGEQGVVMSVKYLPGLMSRYAVKINSQKSPLLFLALAVALTIRGSDVLNRMVGRGR